MKNFKTFIKEYPKAGEKAKMQNKLKNEIV
jgi:hypothetical protein